MRQKSCRNRGETTMHIVKTQQARSRTMLVMGLAALMATAAPVSVASAQSQAQLTIAASAYGAVRPVAIEMNKSMVVDLPAGVAEVVVSQPEIAAGIMRSRTRAIVQGLKEGATNIIFLDDAGRTISVLDINVTQPEFEVGRALEATLARVIPGSNIRVETLSNNTINDKIYFVLTGTVRSAEDKAVAEAMASQLSESDGPTGSLIQVIGPQQVMLQVTVSEVRRDVANQLGINLSGTATIGSAQLGFNTGTAGGDGWSGDVATGSFPGASLQINAAIKALETRGAVHVLAQPVLTAMSGQSADFLAGGELPYTTIDNNSRQTTWKPYGVELKFTPTVKSNGMIGLNVNTSVSEPKSDGSINKRQAATTVELRAGQTLAIGGLIDRRTTADISQIPGLGDIPILGALFRSRQYQNLETELVILVTPYTVAPSPANSIAVPTDYVTPASTAEGIFLGRLENMYGVGASGDFRGGFSGSVGFVLD